MFSHLINGIKLLSKDQFSGSVVLWYTCLDDIRMEILNIMNLRLVLPSLYCCICVVKALFGDLVLNKGRLGCSLGSMFRV